MPLEVLLTLRDSVADTARHGPRVTEAIRDLILSGDLPPGSRIGQEELAARFNVSRIPVREALSRLESDGLVVLKPSSGAWVARLDLQECIEIYKIRERIEPLALHEAVTHMTDDEIDDLAELVEKIENAATDEEFLRLDRAFHLACYRTEGLQQLGNMAERFWNTTQQYRRLFMQSASRDDDWVIHAEHRLIVNALRRRDAEGAGNILHEHIRRTRFELQRSAHLFPATEASKKTKRSEQSKVVRR